MAKQPHPPTAPNHQPIHTLRHRSIKAKIWQNETNTGPMYNVTVIRSYREGEEWRDSHSFGYDDLMNLAKLLYDAHSFITVQRAKEAADRTPKPASGPRRENNSST